MGLFGNSKKLAEQAKQISELQDQIKQISNDTLMLSGATSTQFSELFGLLDSHAGVTVTPASSKRSAAVYACMRLIAGAVSLLPLPVYERTTEGRQKVDHDVWWLLNEQPFPTLTSAAFWDWIISNILLRGDGLAEIKRHPVTGKITGFLPLPRECVVIERRGDQLIYLVNDGVKKYGLYQDDVLHFPGFGFNGVQGESVISHAARHAIGTGLAAEQFSGSFFARGANPSIVIEYPQGVAPNQEQQNALRDQFDERYSGNSNHHRPMLLTNGGNLKAVSLSAEDSQLLETRKFQVIDIARAFGVPPHMIGETSASTSWGSGIEQMSIAFARYTLGPYLIRIEQELNRKLWPRSAKYFIEFNREGLLAGDSKSESEYFGKALGGPGSQGWMTVNEVRRIKNLPPIADGDTIIQAGTQPATGAK